MILVAFIAVERIDVAWQGTGMKPAKMFAETHKTAPVAVGKPAPVTGAPKDETRVAPDSLPAPTLEEAPARATGPVEAEPSVDTRPERMPQAGAGAEDRHGGPAVPTLPAQVAPKVTGLAEQLASRDEPASEPALQPSDGSAGQGQESESDDKSVKTPPTAATALSNKVAAVPVEARYSIQLISFHEKESLARFARDEGLIGKAFRLESEGVAEHWHAVLLGAFTHRAAAEAALADLPARLQRLSPFVRPLASGERLMAIKGP